MIGTYGMDGSRGRWQRRLALACALGFLTAAGCQPTRTTPQRRPSAPEPTSGRNRAPTLASAAGARGQPTPSDTDPTLVLAAGEAQLSPADTRPVVDSDAPLRTYAGRTLTLRTDTRHAYAMALLDKLDSFMSQATAALARILQTPSRPLAVTIVVFETQERYQRHARVYAPGLVNNGGYYDGSKHTVVTYRYNNSMQLYFHELVHALMGERFADHHFSRYTRANWPIWFDEGMSEYLGSYAVDGEGIRVPAPNKGKLAYLANAMDHRAFVELRRLLRAPASRYSGASMNIFYAESWGLIDFLVSDERYRARVPVFFDKVRTGSDGLSAFTASFGTDLDAIEAQWRQHIQQRVKPSGRTVWLFSGHSIDDWTVHEGGDWQASRGEIVGTGDRNYNYLIKNEIPLQDFSFELDILIEKGMAGLILGNNYHGEYPYYYLIDVARDAVTLRRSYTATHIVDVKAAYASVPLGRWVQLRVTVLDRDLSISVDGREVLAARSDRDSYSLFGLYLYHARARFRNVRLLRERRELPGWVRTAPEDRPLVRPAGAGAAAASPQAASPQAASPQAASPQVAPVEPTRSPKARQAPAF